MTTLTIHYLAPFSTGGTACGESVVGSEPIISSTVAEHVDCDMCREILSGTASVPRDDWKMFIVGGIAVIAVLAAIILAFTQRDYADAQTAAEMYCAAANADYDSGTVCEVQSDKIIAMWHPSQQAAPERACRMAASIAYRQLRGWTFRIDETRTGRVMDQRHLALCSAEG